MIFVIIHKYYRTICFFLVAHNPSWCIGQPGGGAAALVPLQTEVCFRLAWKFVLGLARPRARLRTDEHYYLLLLPSNRIFSGAQDFKEFERTRRSEKHIAWTKAVS